MLTNQRLQQLVPSQGVEHQSLPSSFLLALLKKIIFPTSVSIFRRLLSHDSPVHSSRCSWSSITVLLQNLQLRSFFHDLLQLAFTPLIALALYLIIILEKVSPILSKYVIWWESSEILSATFFEASIISLVLTDINSWIALLICLLDNELFIISGIMLGICWWGNLCILSVVKFLVNLNHSWSKMIMQELKELLKRQTYYRWNMDCLPIIVIKFL